MLYLALVLFWTFVILQVASLLHKFGDARFKYRQDETLRLIEESPYLQHLGMRPAKRELPIRLWMFCLAAWGLGIFIISRM